MRRLAPVLVLCAVACTSVLYVQQQCDTLYFGTARPDGTSVTDAEWQEFVHEVIEPRVPGFTQWNAQGEWRGKSEATHVVQIIHPTREQPPIAQMIAEYKQRFAQESVLHVRSIVWLRVR